MSRAAFYAAGAAVYVGLLTGADASHPVAFAAVGIAFAILSVVVLFKA